MSKHDNERWMVEDAAEIVAAQMRIDALTAKVECLKAALETALALMLQQQRDGTTFEEMAEGVDAARAAIAKAMGDA